MISKLNVRLIVLGAIAIGLCGCAPMPAQVSTHADVNYEGLERVNARGIGIAFVRPRVDFRSYTGVLVDEPELAFRTPDRSKQQFPLTESQKTRFSELLAQRFQVELAKSKHLKLVEQPGPDVLTLKIRVQDIVATVSPNALANVGRASIFLEAIGEATIVLELRDSQSEEILARAADTRNVGGAAVIQESGGALTTWSEVESLCERWAAIVRKRLDTLWESTPAVT